MKIPHLGGLDYRYEGVACEVSGTHFGERQHAESSVAQEISFKWSARLFQELGGVLFGDEFLAGVHAFFDEFAARRF